MRSSAATVGSSRAGGAWVAARIGGPEELSLDERVEEIGDRTGTLRASDKLELVGLVARIDDEVKPTPAARRFDELGM
jgi:hypothetical protein